MSRVKPRSKGVTFKVVLPGWLLAGFRDYAEERDRTIAECIREAMEAWGPAAATVRKRREHAKVGQGFLI